MPSQNESIQPGPTSSTWMFIRIALIASILLAYSPLFGADFTIWDDWYNIVENPHLNPPTWSNVGYYWSHSAFDLYIPVTYTVWAGLAYVGYVKQPDAWGAHLNSYIFHAANVFLHAGAALCVLEILRRLVRDPIAAALGAFLFALHPVQVESVGWVAGMKDVLAGFLSFLAILLYLKDDVFLRARLLPSRAPSDDLGSPGASPTSAMRIRFMCATLVFILAMLAKPIAMVMPAIVIAIDVLVRKRFNRRVLFWFIPAIGCGIMAKVSQPAPYEHIFVPLWSRPFIVGDSIAFYLYKLIWPLNLGIDYGRSPRETLASGAPYFTVLLPLVVAAVLWFKRRSWPIVLAGAITFVIARGIL